MIRLKSNKEIAGIRRSCRLLADMFRMVIPEVKAGVSTKDLDNMCRRFMTAHGGKPAWYKEDFPGAVCISINDEVIHGVPSKRRIVREGDLVSIDAGIDLDGFISDSTHTVEVGHVRDEVHQLHQVTLQCLEAGIKACVAGNRIKDVSRAIDKIATSHGYGIVREYCGHGVGLDVHEDPNVPNCVGRGANPRIQSGMVLAIEPMITMGSYDVYTAKDEWTVRTSDGKPSAHEEHTVAVFDDHTEILTLL